jgi:hypothetical protein
LTPASVPGGSATLSSLTSGEKSASDTPPVWESKYGPHVRNHLEEFTMTADSSVPSPLSLLIHWKISWLCLIQCLLFSLYAVAQDEKVISFDPPGSHETIPLSMNNAGSITGYHNNGNGIQGLLRAPNGSFTTIEVPGAISTTPWSINDAGSIAGYFLVESVSELKLFSERPTAAGSGCSGPRS